MKPPAFAHPLTVMSMPDPCLPSNPDISGIGVRTAIYAQNILSFVPAFFALKDRKVTPLELEALETQSTNILITAFAILLSVIIQALQHGLTNYHAAIILNLSWMNNTNLFIYLLLYTYHTFELRDGGVGHSGDQRTLRAFCNSWMKKAMKNPVLIIGSLHLSLMSAVGIWLWVKPKAFGNSPPCSLVASLFIVGQRASIGSQGLRKWSLLIYSLLLIPVLNLIIPISFFAPPIWVYGRFLSFPLERESILRFTRAGLAVLAVINAVLLADTEIAIHRNQALTVKGDGDWTFGQTLALLLLLIPIHDIGEALSQRHAGPVGERLKDAAKTGNVGMAREAIKSGAPKSAIVLSVIAAIKGDHWDVIELLIEDAREPSEMKRGGEMLKAASKAGNLGAVHDAINSGVSGSAIVSSIIIALKEDHWDVARVLMETAASIAAIHHLSVAIVDYFRAEFDSRMAKIQEELNATDSDGRNTLRDTAENRNTETIRVLVERGATLDNLVGRTSLSLANDHGHTQVADYPTKHHTTPEGLEVDLRGIGSPLETIDEVSR
ncbi:hypothetical protein D9756_000007 [Leucocoprinus leucothites]|uniref:Uncharacterized protein n=1 Tax=Leucocoprinus leucothites TaxID=201217 RepID=A0A8H5GF99_9AGAR|nr:hypothetical protein D9756_000007 [Leucoagaricus leucothites]